MRGRPVPHLGAMIPAARVGGGGLVVLNEREWRGPKPVGGVDFAVGIVRGSGAADNVDAGGER